MELLRLPHRSHDFRGSSVQTNAMSKEVNLTSPKEYFAKMYYEAIDRATAEIDRRFTSPGVVLGRKIEQFLLTCIQQDNNNTPPVLPIDIADWIEEDVNLSRLQRQLHLLPEAVSTAKSATDLQVGYDELHSKK